MTFQALLHCISVVTESATSKIICNLTVLVGTSQRPSTYYLTGPLLVVFSKLADSVRETHAAGCGNPAVRSTSAREKQPSNVANSRKSHQLLSLSAALVSHSIGALTGQKVLHNEHSRDGLDDDFHTRAEVDCKTRRRYRHVLCLPV